MAVSEEVGLQVANNLASCLRELMDALLTVESEEDKYCALTLDLNHIRAEVKVVAAALYDDSYASDYARSKL